MLGCSIAGDAVARGTGEVSDERAAKDRLYEASNNPALVIAAPVAFQLIFGEGMTNVRDAAEEGDTPSNLDFAIGIGHYWFGIVSYFLFW